MKLGATAINDLKLGTADVQKVHQGASLVWQRAGSSAEQYITWGNFHGPGTITQEGNDLYCTGAGWPASLGAVGQHSFQCTPHAGGLIAAIAFVASSQPCNAVFGVNDDANWSPQFQDMEIAIHWENSQVRLMGALINITNGWEGPWFALAVGSEARLELTNTHLTLKIDGAVKHSVPYTPSGLFYQPDICFISDGRLNSMRVLIQQ